MALPDTYQKVAYIESMATNPWDASSSGQYIDTLVTINKNIKVEIDMQFTVLTSQQRLFGWLYDSWSSWITFWPYINWSTQWARATSNWTWNWQSTNVAANTNRNKFVLDNNTYTIYDSAWTQVHSGANSATISNSDTWTIPLLASKDRSANKVNRHSSAKLYWCKIYDSWTLVRELIPCYRKSDSVIWMYDLVNDVFYINAGSGNFIKGPDVNRDNKIKRIYVGDHYQVYPKRTPWSNLISYYPLDWDILDHKADLWVSWTTLNLSTYTWTITYWTLSWWKKYGIFNGSTLLSRTITTTYPQTIMCWAKGTWTQTSYRGIVWNNGAWLIFRRWDTDYIWCYDWGGSAYRSTWVSLSTTSWQHLAMTINGSIACIYINWVKYWPYNNSYSGQTTPRFWVWWWFQNTTQAFTWNIWDVFSFTRELTEQEIKDYYNSTKATYLWIS